MAEATAAHRPDGEGGVVVIFCGRSRAGGRPVTFGSGRRTRDLVYVGDVVAANLAAPDAAVTGAYNDGTGKETSVLDFPPGAR